MLSKETYKKILGLDGEIWLDTKEMADKMNVTFFPIEGKNISQNVLHFRDRLKKTLIDLNVNIVPYEKSLTKISLFKAFKSLFKVILNNIIYAINKIFHLPEKNIYMSFEVVRYIFKRVKVKKGISIICVGEQETENLPMQFIYSFKDNSVITILDFPKHINENSSFDEHFETAMNLFVHNMTNIVLGVSDKDWILYNFNGSHPVFPIDSNFKDYVLNALIPKIVAPIRPYKLDEFKIVKDGFSHEDLENKRFIDQIVDGAKKFERLNLYPKGKKIDDLPFRNEFFKWVGKIHLDHRNGMSFGFLAHQMPVQPTDVFKTDLNEDFFEKDGKEYIVLRLNNNKYAIEIPSVWVISQKSGSDKTNVNREKDLIKIGLSKGKMFLQGQKGAVIDNTYKPSFDTKVILAHALGNAIISSLLNFIDPGNAWTERMKKNGSSLSHWHGYFHADKIPDGLSVHGISNPHVACSSPQSAVYAISGKLESFVEMVISGKKFNGDIHIEPHHGININFTSIPDLAEYLLCNPDATKLGNEYLLLYNKKS